MIVSSFAASTAKPLGKENESILVDHHKSSTSWTAEVGTSSQMITKAVPDSLAQLFYCHFVFVVKPPFKDNIENWAISTSTESGDYLKPASSRWSLELSVPWAIATLSLEDATIQDLTRRESVKIDHLGTYLTGASWLMLSSSASNLGEIVSRSQPASANTWEKRTSRF